MRIGQRNFTLRNSCSYKVRVHEVTKIWRATWGLEWSPQNDIPVKRELFTDWFKNNSPVKRPLPSVPSEGDL